MKDTSLTDDDGNDHTVDTQDTSHDDGNERFHDYSGSPDRNAADACACLGSTIGCSEVCMGEEVLASTSASETPMKPKKAAAALSCTG